METFYGHIFDIDEDGIWILVYVEQDSCQWPHDVYVPNTDLTEQQLTEEVELGRVVEIHRDSSGNNELVFPYHPPLTEEQKEQIYKKAEELHKLIDWQ